MKIISNNDYSRWGKRNNLKIKQKDSAQVLDVKEKITHLSGFVNLNVMVFFVFAVIGFFYLYSMNGSTMQGYKIKEIEKEIEQLRDEADKLKIKEAELNSLYRIEGEGQNLDMHQVNDEQYLSESKSVALR